MCGTDGSSLQQFILFVQDKDRIKITNLEVQIDEYVVKHCVTEHELMNTIVLVIKLGIPNRQDLDKTQ
jgi:hypothetical protein